MRASNEIKVTLPFLLLLLLQIEAKKPPGFLEKQKEIDPDPPNYEYGYKIKDEKAEQGKDEKRTGQFSQGSYYVNDSEDGTDSKKKIKYFTDDWGFHTIAEYSNNGPNSKSSVTYIGDQEALKYNNNGNIIPDLDPNNNMKKTNPEKPSLTQPPTPTQPTTLLSQEQVDVDPNQVLLQSLSRGPNPHTIPHNQQNVPQQIDAGDPNQLQFFYIEPDNLQQSLSFAPSALENQHLQLQQILLQGEVLPAPQPLVYNQEASFNFNNDINIPSASGSSVSYRTNIVHTPHIKPDKTNPFSMNTEKLIESTKNLVSGADVIDINDSVENLIPDSESSTLESLLQHYVTPTLTKEVTNVDINHLGEVLTTPSSLLNEPIVVADELSNASEKPVVDENLLSESMNLSATSNSLHPEKPVNILVTPRPVSTKFLAPITAGIQLEQTQQLMQETQPIELHSKETVVVTVQKSEPHYLGKYEYPTAYAAAYTGHNASDYAKEDIELGTTLLHFTEAPLRAEKLVQELPKVEQEQIFSDIKVNHLNQPQDSQIFDQSQFYPHQPHTVTPFSKAPPITTQQPVYTPQYVDEPMPFMQSYSHIEKPNETRKFAVQNKVPVQNKMVPYTNKHHTSAQNQIPRYDHKKHEVYLLQFPKQLFQPNKHQKYWNQPKTRHQNVLYTNHYDSYAPQVKNYLSSKQRMNIDRGYLPIKGLQKLELQEFSSHNVHNLPPITKSFGENLHTKGYLPPITQPWITDIKNDGRLSSYLPAKTYLTVNSYNGHQPTQIDSVDSYRIPSNNEYLPPQNLKCQEGSCNSPEQQGSFTNYFHIVPSATAPLGLVPPKSSGLRFQQDLVASPSEPKMVTGLRYNNHEVMPSPIINIPSNSLRYQHYEALPLRNNAAKFNSGVRYHRPEAEETRYHHEIEGRRSPRSHFFDESSVRMEYGFMPPFKPSQKIREVLEVNPE